MLDKVEEQVHSGLPGESVILSSQSVTSQRLAATVGPREGEPGKFDGGGAGSRLGYKDPLHDLANDLKFKS